MNDRFFYYAIIVSLAAHAVVMTHFFITRHKDDLWKKPSEMFCSIVRPEPMPRDQPLVSVPLPGQMDRLVEVAKFPENGKVPQPPRLDPFFDESGAMDNVQMFERKPERLKGVKVTKEVSVPMLKSDKINTPSYVTYYQIVRDRIRDRAYSNYIKLSMGEVFVTFVIKSDGRLSGLQVLEQKSTANEFLRHVGLKSVQEGAPFPPFPKDLNYPELTFNVSISFQYKEE